MHGAVRGVVDNPGAPADVLVRLLAEEASDAWSFLAWRGLPAEVVEAVIAHPDVRVRRDFTQNTTVSGETRARLVEDPSPRVRLALAAGPGWFRVQSPALPEWAQLRLINDAHPRIRAEALSSPETSIQVLAGLADEEDPERRRAACRAWALLDAASRMRLLSDPVEEVRAAAARAASPGDPDASGAYLAATAGQKTYGVRSRVVRRAALHEATARRLADGEDGAERAAVAGNPRVPVDLVRHLAVDREHAVRLAFASRPDLSESERAAVDYQVRREDRLDPLEWVLDERDPEILRRCARSANAWIRRSTACNKHLPQDVVELLGADEDFPVRILLCENQPTVDGEIVLDTFLRWDSVVSAALQQHPNFPRHHLAARFADDPDKHRRWLIYQDETAPAATVLALSHDPDVNVRRSIAGHPNLPVPRLLEMIEDPDVGIVERAAANRSLPPEAMHRLLDAAGIPRRE